MSTLPALIWDAVHSYHVYQI